MVNLIRQPWQVVFEDSFDATEPGCYIIGLFARLEGLATLWNLAGDAMLAGCFAIALLLAAITFRAGKVYPVPFSCSARVGLGVIHGRVVTVLLWGVRSG